MAIDSEITLSNQERGKESACAWHADRWEYRACLPRRLRRRQVIAVNKACLCGYARTQADEWQPSNTVMAVLGDRMMGDTGPTQLEYGRYSTRPRSQVKLNANGTVVIPRTKRDSL